VEVKETMNGSKILPIAITAR